jgi:hypothetical protein
VIGRARSDHLPPVLSDPEVSTIASCAWVTLVDGSVAAPGLLRQFQLLSRTLPPTIAWVVLRVPSPGMLTLETAAAVSVAHRALEARGQHLVLHTPTAPTAPGTLSALQAVPTIIDGDAHVGRIRRLRQAAMDLRVLRRR